ncbi:serine/threonine protein kinase [Sphaeroforma arctica JP610]|uniref:Serine/threonine protein kinase n=1 Tax=Sphaeroforma arctica JP610 TaxID=667725 RepID=A0A0L0G6E0_9EUKA|nr:serine/threonine protein kinase [Sphaeroforma arctica JP610]KNC84575.1 serine/threonine protein kinase [Sphaeroforma arctica JP610]|eukprot:XP_014158477.1 serine/threonine protein kinase [Sphaeroforma arctica JP610]
MSLACGKGISSHRPHNLHFWESDASSAVKVELNAKRFIRETALQTGSTGVVTKAYDTHLGRPVAVKKMNMSRFHDLKEREYVIGKAVGRHPNVATTYDKVINLKRGQVKLVLELCEGGDLVDLLSEKPHGFDRREFIHLARELSSGLRHIHSKGVAHRDIKSDNVCISTEDGRAKILDFGESQFISDPVDTLKSGTVVYLAPELVHAIEKGNNVYNHQGLDFDLLKSDVWSLGITFYSMLTSQIPFACASMQDSGYRNYVNGLTFGTPKSWTVVDEDLKFLLEHMCEPYPVLRWTMEEVVTYLAGL